jgi:hypothetical protein
MRVGLRFRCNLRRLTQPRRAARLVLSKHMGQPIRDSLRFDSVVTMTPSVPGPTWPPTTALNSEITTSP